jgi:2'-5' RNA ligase
VGKQTRAFAAILVPEAVRADLAAALERAAREAGARRSPWVPARNWHVTLAFFGDLAAAGLAHLEQGLAGIAAEWFPFDVHAEGAGRFGDGLTWIGLGGKARRVVGLMRAAEQLLADAGAPRGQHQSRPIPHLTVSRDGNAERWVRALHGYRGPGWTVGEITLMASHLGQGPGGSARYSPIARFPFPSG